MRLVQRKSEPDRLLEAVSNSLGAVSGGVKSESDRLLETASNSLGAVSGGVNRSTLVKAGLIAGGLAALTAGSAAISSIRRRMEGSDS
jgi:hypothetical protein